MALTRYLPDAGLLVKSILDAGLATDGVRVRLDLEADLVDHLPYVAVLARRLPSRHPRLAGSASVTVESWHDASFRACRDLDEACRVLLWQAHHDQSTWPQGHLSRYREGTNIELPSGRTGVWRLSSSYDLGLRPSATP